MENLKLKCDMTVLKEMSSILRGNARAAQKMANNMKTYLQAKNSKKFTNKDWAIMRDELGILPLGVNRIELIVLNALKEKKECSLTHLAAKTGLTPQCLRQDSSTFQSFATNCSSSSTPERV